MEIGGALYKPLGEEATGAGAGGGGGEDSGLSFNMVFPNLYPLFFSGSGILQNLMKAMR